MDRICVTPCRHMRYMGGLLRVHVPYGTCNDESMLAVETLSMLAE
jgi:hypothetical protein